MEIDYESADRIIREKTSVLADTPIPNSAHSHLATAAAYYHYMHGIDPGNYWTSPRFNLRDEMLLVFLGYIHAETTILKESHPESLRESFDWAYGYFLKPNAQTVMSLDLLASNACYFDAFALVRLLHSRVLLTLRFSLDPNLSELWIRDPTDNRFREARLRTELRKAGITTFEHLYKLGNEMIHSHAIGHSTLGFNEQGLMPRIGFVESQVYVIATILFAPLFALGTYVLRHSPASPQDSEAYEGMQDLCEYITSQVVSPGRVEHLWATLAEDRHVQSASDGMTIIGESFDFNSLEESVKAIFGKSGPSSVSETT